MSSTCTRRSLPRARRQGFVDGFSKKFVEGGGVLDLRDVTDARDHGELGAGDESCEAFALRKRGYAVERTPDDIDRDLEPRVRGRLLAGRTDRRTDQRGKPGADGGRGS